MGYMALKAQQKKKEEDRQKNIMQQKNMAFIKSTNTAYTSIPDMKSAYQSVMDSNHTQSQEYIHYQRHTSGRVLDAPSSKEK